MVLGAFQRDRNVPGLATCDEAAHHLRHCAGRGRRIFGSEDGRTTLRSPSSCRLLLSGLRSSFGLLGGLARREKDLGQVSLPDAISIGSAQALALIPGTSRSGITIATGLFRGLTREAAARFSFLLSAPITAGALLKKLLDLRATGIPAADRLPMLFGFLSSLIIGYLTIKFLMRYLQRNSLQIFVVYRIALGVVILILIQFAGFRP
jgi:undecaprenyl-diphosphatase